MILPRHDSNSRPGPAVRQVSKSCGRDEQSPGSDRPLPDEPNHSEIWLDWLDHELRQAVGSIFGLSFYMIGHPAIGPILSLLG